MKKKIRYTFIFGVLLSVFAVLGCNNSVGGGNNGGSENNDLISNFAVSEKGMTWASFTWDREDDIEKYELDIKSNQYLINKNDELPVKIANLEAGKEYDAYLYAYKQGSSVYDKYATLTFKTNSVGPVENLSAEVDGESIKLSWKYITKTDINKFEIYRKVAGETEFDFQVAFDNSSYSPKNSWVDENVTKDTTYIYRVDSRSLYDLFPSEEVTILADFDNLNLTATSIGMTEATFEWDADARFDKFFLYKDSTSKKEVIPTDSSVKLSESLDNLKRNATNTIYLDCYKNDSLVKTIKKNITTKNSGPVEGLKSSISTSYIRLSWNSLSSSDVSKIKVFRKNGSSFEELGEKTSYNTSYDDTEYIAGVVNEYKVTTYLSDGTEAGSKEISVDASGYCSVTFDYGTYGQNYNNKSSEIKRCEKGSTVTEPNVYIKSNYNTQIKFLYWSVSTEDFSFSDSINQNIVLKAIYQTKPISNLKVKANNTNVVLKWTGITDVKYTIKLTKLSTSEITTISDIETCSYIFNSLENDVQYKAAVYANSSFTDVLASTPVETSEFKLTKQHSEWLVILYLDGDNDLNDPIYFDLNEAEWGLSQLSSTDDVRILALWDGWDFASNNPKDKVSFFSNESNDSTVHTTASTRLLELGKDSRTLYASNGGIYFTACELSPDTLDLTETVDWIENGEVDMSKRTTLESYLQWVNENYDADKTILQFSNHGGGPRSASMKKGNYGRRSMCWDYSNNGDGDSFLKTSDVSAALSAAGYGTDNKLTMIMEDVCLGGSLEETYELKDYAEYYVGSPNNIPGMGFDYKAFVSSLKKDADITTIGSKLVYSYSKDYTMSDNEWNAYFTKLGTTADFVTENGLAEYVSYLNPDCSTLTFVDLSKIGKVKEEVDKLAEIIREDTTQDKRIKYDVDSGKYYDTADTSVPVPETAVSVSRKEAVKYLTAYFGDPIYYEGSFGSLKDLGYMANVLNKVYLSSGNTWLAVYNQTSAVKDALKEAIVACWRDGYKKASYYKSNSGFVSSYSSSLYGYGLTINCSVWVPHKAKDGQTYLFEDFADWYKEELAFGRDCSNWAALIEEWFKISD